MSDDIKETLDLMKEMRQAAQAILAGPRDKLYITAGGVLCWEGVGGLGVRHEPDVSGRYFRVRTSFNPHHP